MLRPQTVPTAHSFLRKSTQRLHRRIDQTSVLARLTSPGVTLDLYCCAMRSLQRAYVEIDLTLLNSCGLCPAGVPLYVPRGLSINRDLIALDMPLDESQRARPRCGLRAPESEAAYLGVRYVVEGAQLGGRLIYNHLYGVFGDKLSGFGSFWMPGSVLQGSWPCVLKSLARMESRASIAAAARAARLTFQHMAAYLDGSEEAVIP